MPHQCTNCERVFPDGSKEMLSGCPDCGGNKFQFRPDPDDDPPTLGSDDAGSSPDRSPSQSPASDPPAASADRTAGQSSTTPWPSAQSTPADDRSPGARDEEADASPASTADEDGELIEAESDPAVLDDEDTAQADARRDVISREELDRAAESPPQAADDARTVPPTGADAPDIDDLRAELNDQFESIKILEPGQYELNLMELYDRQECIISLQEDGHYVIEVADTWRDD
jgi:hypothetical protein